MSKILKSILIGILVSFYFYPVGLFILPEGLNTKMILGAAGIAIFIIGSLREGKVEIDKDILLAGCIAALFSVFCMFSTTANNTQDDSYSTYFVSFLVWTFGAYCVCFCIRMAHKSASLDIITVYLTWVAVFQCFAAQMIDDYPAIKNFVDLTFRQDFHMFDKVNRLYGIGASLDSGGIRFAITLVLLARYIVNLFEGNSSRVKILLYLLAFIAITILGNMISRTTTVGMLLGLFYLVICYFNNISITIKEKRLWTFVLLAISAAILIPSIINLYRTNSDFYEDMRFAFEGFFNWAETGTFRTDSTDKLNNTMWIWPETTKAWLIGTGRFGNWAFGTDIGYCRFVLYCGVLGFLIFAYFFIFNAKSLSQRVRNSNLLALCMLALSFAVWLKVSTDIYQIYALVYCMDASYKELA